MWTLISTWEGDGDGRGIIINGAATSIGAYAVQLAKRAGLFVVATAGASGAYVRCLGADVVVDYREHEGDDLVSSPSLPFLFHSFDETMPKLNPGLGAR